MNAPVNTVQAVPYEASEATTCATCLEAIRVGSMAVAAPDGSPSHIACTMIALDPEARSAARLAQLSGAMQHGRPKVRVAGHREQSCCCWCCAVPMPGDDLYDFGGAVGHAHIACVVDAFDLAGRLAR